MTGLTVPMTYKPMLAHSAPKPFNDPKYLFEPKYDGIRCIAYVNKGEATLINRAGNNVTARFPDVVQQLRRDTDRNEYVVLDGEIVCFKGRMLSEGGDGQVPDFQAMQTRMNRKEEIDRLADQHPAYFYAFDMLSRYSSIHNSVYDMTSDPLYVRRSHLRNAISELWTVHAERGDGTGMALIYENWEGIMAKRHDSLYLPGKRSREWLKIKFKQTRVFTIMGYTAGEGKRAGLIGALLLAEATKDDAGLITYNYVGKVGTGFTDYTLTAITDLVLDASEMVGSYYELPSTSIIPGQLWCSVEYAERTDDNKLRFPSFKSMENDPWKT